MIRKKSYSWSPELTRDKSADHCGPSIPGPQSDQFVAPEDYPKAGSASQPSAKRRPSSRDRFNPARANSISLVSRILHLTRPLSLVTGWAALCYANTRSLYDNTRYPYADTRLSTLIHLNTRYFAPPGGCCLPEQQRIITTNKN